MERSFDRRKFLKASGLVAASALGAATLASCAPNKTGDNNHALHTSGEIAWDKEADFVVIGSGTALTGALKAAVDGAAVIVVEKAAKLGGTTAVSGGQVWAPCNRYSETPDDLEAARTYMTKVADGLSTDAIIDTYLNTVNDMVELVATEAGVQWSVSPRVDYHANWEGSSKNTRSLACEIDGVRSGSHFIQAETAALESLGAEILTSTAATRLITRPGENGVSEVLGIAAEQGSKTLNIKARKGVLIGAGGFGFNWEMRKTYHNIPTHYSMTVPEDTGDGILMGQAVGCQLALMPFFWGEVALHTITDEDEYENGVHSMEFGAYLYQSQPGSIFVNRKGKRFCNESSDYDSLAFGFQGQETTGDMRFTNVPAFYICDQSVRDTLGDSFFGVGPTDPMPEWAWEANSIEELADKAGIEKEGLVAQIEKWNNDVASGIDSEFHRGESEFESYNLFRQDGGAAFAPINQAPFYACRLMPALLGTKGGIKVNEKSQAIHANGEIVPRLYACGNSSGYGAPGKYYTGAGSTIGAGMVAAYNAAIDALSLDSWA